MAADKIMDHNAYPKKLRGKTPAELRFIVKDAGEAMRANPNNTNNGYYADEAAYAGMELKRRGLA
jgi:hypothetical protein